MMRYRESLSFKVFLFGILFIKMINDTISEILLNRCLPLFRKMLSIFQQYVSILKFCEKQYFPSQIK